MEYMVRHILPPFVRILTFALLLLLFLLWLFLTILLFPLWPIGLLIFIITIFPYVVVLRRSLLRSFVHVVTAESFYCTME